MNNFNNIFTIFIIGFLLHACSESKKLHLVTVDEFATFVNATGYVTEAEKYDWSIVQQDVFNFQVLYGIDWRCPDGMTPAIGNHQVTQVSYNDALAYAKWKNTRLPTYEEYWNLVKNDSKSINSNSAEILNPTSVNIVGNVWELTIPNANNQVRMAGGSYLCDEQSCNGTSQGRVLYVDRETGNTHIGFGVME